MNRIYRIAVLIVAGLFLIHCVSPYYGTARIEPGWDGEIGLGLGSWITPVLDASGYNIGPRVDISIGYGFNRYLKTYAHLGGGLGTVGPILDPGIGMQISMPLDFLTPALRTEIDGYWLCPSFSPSFLVGFGKDEFLTLGVRTHFNLISDLYWGYAQNEYPFDVFTAFHLSKRWSLFAGGEISSLTQNVNYYNPFFTFGVAYKYDLSRSKSRNSK